MPEIEWLVPEPAPRPPIPGPAWVPPAIEDTPYAAHRARRLRSRRQRLLGAALAVLLTAAGIGTWVLLRPDPLTVTYAGARVTDLGPTVERADSVFRTYATSHHGVVAKSSRCYLLRVGGTKPTDVSDTLFCGPVLFAGGAAPAEYLVFELTSRRSGRGSVTLTGSSTPQSVLPTVLPAGPLQRPDGRRPPRHSGLTPPAPTPAAPDQLFSGEQTDLPDLPPLGGAGDIIGSRDVRVEVYFAGFVARFGYGGDQRVAAPGQKLLGFVVTFGDGEINAFDENTRVDLGLSVDGGPTRRLPAVNEHGGNYRAFAASVPIAMHRADLVLADAGFTQRLSLLDGKVGSGNIQVLHRTDLHETVAASGTALANVHDGSSRYSAHLTISVAGAHLEFFTPVGVHPASTRRAFVYVELCYQSLDFEFPDECYRFRPSTLLLRPDGGPSVPARQVGDEPDHPYSVFEVPADFQSGTLVVGGSETSGDGWSMTIVRPFRHHFSI